MTKLNEGKNFIDNPKGRKWSWGSFTFIGEFTTIDFFIVMIGTLVIILNFILLNFVAAIIINIIIFLLMMVFIKEVKGNKFYELIWNYLSFWRNNQEIDILSYIEEKEENVYEVISGFDVTNLTEDLINKIDIYFNRFYKKVSGELKIIKTTSTYRLTDVLDKLDELFLKESKTKLQKEIIASYFENINYFKKENMPNLYLKFSNMNDLDIRAALKEIEPLLEIRKIPKIEWQAIQWLEFNGERFWKIKRSKIVSKNKNLEKSIVKVNFERNVPSLFLNDYIYNDNTSFVIDFKTPDYKEIQKVKKSIKKWAKNVEDDSIVGKDFLDKMDKTSKKEAKNEVIMNWLFGNDDLKYFNVYITISKDEKSELSFKKQISIMSLDSQMRTNFSLNPLYSKQKEGFDNLYWKRNEYRFFPTNSSTITNILPFQNQAILDKGGGYIGYSGGRFPFVFHPFRKKGISGFHTGIISKTGGGKSTLLKLLSGCDFAIDNAKQIFLDPKNEFRIVNEAIGGKTINVNITALNPLKLQSRNTEDIKQIIDDKSIEIKEFLFIVFRREAELNGEIVEKISSLADEIKKFYLQNEKLILNDEEFIFSDIKKWFFKKGITKFDNILDKFINGIFSRFNNKDELDFDKQNIAFELLHVKKIEDEAIRDAIMFLITTKVVNWIYANQIKQDKISLWIDEAGWFFKSNFLTKKIESLMVEARSFNTKITWATQNITDLINQKNDGERLISIFSNTEHLFLGQIKTPQRQAINKLFEGAGANKLSKSELNWIEDSDLPEDRGKFLYIRGGYSRKVKVDLKNQFILKDAFFEKHQFTYEED